MKQISLNGAWQAVCRMPDGSCFPMSGQVPGSSIHDLICAGKLPDDLFWRDNADAVEAFERCGYDYSLEFDYTPAPGSRCDLTFERLDTYCTVTLNETTLGECFDEHIPHTFDVTDALKSGSNRLCVQFDSPIVRTDGLPRPEGAFTRERMNTRRTQCTYGWDWVARFVGCGINGNVTLRETEETDVIFQNAYVYTKNLDEDSAGLGIDLNFASPLPSRVLTVRIVDPNGALCRRVDRFVNEPFVRLSLDVPKPKLWYPVGYGEHPLYTLEVLDGETLIHRETFSIRTVKILQLPDEPGTDFYQKCLSIKNEHYDFNEVFSGFLLKINGVKILCKGANWVPCEPFCVGSTDRKITEALELAAEAGLNMLRVWGGGTFETAHFYDECSRLGILVTQDFLMACGRYPEKEDWFIDCLRREAEYAALHIRNKACLMWWSGDNENAVDGCDLDNDYMGRRSAYEGIAPVLYRLDPYREFLPSSPFGGRKYASNTVGTTHNTQYLGSDILPYMLGGDCGDYRQVWKRFRARFIAEDPQLGACSYQTLRRFMTDEDIFGERDDMWKYHTKTNPGLSTHLFDISTSFAQSLLGRFVSPEDRFFKLRYLQYEWIRFTMEQLRREMWFCSGDIYWMYNDCWPAASGWALVDYYNHPKDAWYAFKRCAGPVVISLDCENGQFVTYACNEGAAVPGARIRLLAVCGETVRTIAEFAADLPAATVTKADSRAVTLGEGEVLIAEIEAGETRDRTFYVPGAMTMVPSEVTLTRHGDFVEVHAEQYVHAVELNGDAVFSDNCFSLLPGETRRVPFRELTKGEITAIAYTI